MTEPSPREEMIGRVIAARYLSAAVGRGKLAQEIASALAAENARLWEALKKYGMHLTECEANESYGVEPCSCGLKQLLADEQAPEGK